MENNEDDKFVSLLADSTFKYMFKDYRLDILLKKDNDFIRLLAKLITI